MAKAKSTYTCNSCGSVSNKWSGKCDGCGEWNSIEESIVTSFTKMDEKSAKSLEIEPLSGDIKEASRFECNLEEFNRVLGGGLVKGSAILIGGDPGIGKSTLLIQTLSHLADASNQVLYITGEESLSQVKLRAKRLGIQDSNVPLLSATRVEDILATLKQAKPDIVVIDSIQTMFVGAIESAPGSVAQVRQSAHELIQYCKQYDVSIILVGHVTKDGHIAGPKLLEHMVDAVLYFEGDSSHHYRLLRSIKNRFGAANEVGVFEMTSRGLEEVLNPSSLFISEANQETAGSVIFASIEGTRPMLVEIQALVSESTMANPRRAVVGWDSNRLAMMLAVLQRRCGMKFFDKEVYLNVAGGIKLTEPAADLAVAMALMSALANIPAPQNSVIFGEISLSGDIRSVNQSDARLKEAKKLGFECAIVPSGKIETVGDFKLQKLESIIDCRKLLA